MQKLLKKSISLFSFLFLLTVFTLACINLYHSNLTQKNLENISKLCNKPEIMEFIEQARVKERQLDIATFVFEIAILLIAIKMARREREVLQKQELAEQQILNAEINASLLMERQAKQEAELISKTQAEVLNAKEAYLVLFTHELKTPLNAVINFSKYIARKTAANEELTKIRELALAISKNGQSMLDTVNNLLEIARIKSGKITITEESIRLSQIINDIIARYKELATKQNMETILAIKNDLNIKTDQFYLGYLLANIYTNAVKYGRSKILITANTINDNWEVMIEDDGPGIRDMIVFELFEQGDAKHSQGTGVGLYFCKLLAELLDLHIKIDSSQTLGGAKITVCTKDYDDSVNS